MTDNLYFQYLTLNETLYKFYQNGVDNVDISLLISLEKDYYEGENMKLIMADLRRLMKNKKILMDYNGIKEEFKVNKLNLLIGDTINKHIFYYRFCAKYFEENNINQEEKIPQQTKEQFELESYILAKKEGREWLQNNMCALNLFSDEKQLTKDYIKNITESDFQTIFEETENTPKMNYIGYDYYYKHPAYLNIAQSLKELCKEYDFINRCYTHEAEYFYDRLEHRGETPKYKKLFLEQSYKYLFEETMYAVIENSKQPHNYFDLYYFGKLPNHLNIYNGKQAKKNKSIQKILNNELFGIDLPLRVSIRPSIYCI